MTPKFKKQLKGNRLVLKITRPTLKMAQSIFNTIIQNRKHLEIWFPWARETVKLEDTLKHLFDKENETKIGNKVEYGVFINNKHIGNISLLNIDQKKKSGEIGYWISSNYTRKGYATEAVKMVEKEAFEHIGLNRVQIRCDEKNEPSAGVAKKCGYSYEGTIREESFSEYFGYFRNMLIFSKLQSEYKKQKNNG